MLLTLRQQLTKFAHMLQEELFPTVEAEVGELSEPAKRLTAVLAMIPLRRFVPVSKGWNGRPPKDRYCIACSFVAKVVYNFPQTRDLLDRLQNDPQLRMICGWKPGEKIPHESTFSRAFAEFAQMELPQFVHEALIRETQKDRLSAISPETQRLLKSGNGSRTPRRNPHQENRTSLVFNWLWHNRRSPVRPGQVRPSSRQQNPFRPHLLHRPLALSRARPSGGKVANRSARPKKIPACIGSAV